MQFSDNLTPLNGTSSYIRIQVPGRGKNEEEKIQVRTKS